MSGRRDGNLRALARERGFTRLLTTRLTSQFGDGLFQAALAGSVLFNPAQQTSPAKIAAGFAVLLVPFSLLGPYVGVFLDRWRRRSIIYLANVVRATLAVPAAFLMVTGGPGGGFFVCALLIAAVNRFFLSGLSAAQPHVVPESLLITSNAASSTLGTVAYSLGLGVSSLALHTLVHANDTGYAWLALTGAAGYLTAALMARAWFAPDDLGPDEAAIPAGTPTQEIVVIARGMVAGAAHLVERRPIAYAYALQGFNRVLYGVLTLSTLLLYSRYFYSSYSAALTGLGQVVVVGSIGAVVAAFITPYASRKVGVRRWIVLLTALIAVSLPPLGLPYLPILLVTATFVANVSSQGIKIVVDTAVQTRCAESFRGRIFSIGDMMFNVFFVFGLFIGAATLPDNGRSPTMILVVSGGYALVAVAFAWLTRDTPPLPEIGDDLPMKATA